MVAVVDTNQQPLAPTTPRRARLLLRRGKAAVFKRFPFVIILIRPIEQPALPALRLKLDPGAKTTGLALLNQQTGQVVWAAEVTHRGDQIRQALADRRRVRRSRRWRHTRYRTARFLNRRRKPGWLPPSQQSRVANTLTWVRRLARIYPIAALSLELARFDTQAIQNPEIVGMAYQQGELAGYELRQYLLLKWGRRCAYCGATGAGVRLEIDHIQPRAGGGSNRASNLCVACQPCNQAKGNRSASDFGHPEVERFAKAPLKDAAAINSTRWALYQALQALGLPLEVGTGGRTAYNRARLALPKTHWIDAAVVGTSTPAQVRIDGVMPLRIRARGHGTRQLCGTDKYGFPIRHRQRVKQVQGWQTGDLGEALVPAGVHRGRWRGRVTIRATGSFRVGRADGINWRYCRRLHRADGYEYGRTPPQP